MRRRVGPGAPEGFALLRTLCFTDLLGFFRGKHHGKADGKQEASDPNGFSTDGKGKDTADSCTDSENHNDPEVNQAFLQDALIFFPKVGTQRFCCGAKVSDAHRTGVHMPSHLMEGLYLQGADKGNKCICHRVKHLRQKADGKKQQDFKQKNDLPPVYFLAAFQTDVYELCCRCSDEEGHNRNEIFQGNPPFLLKERCAEEHYVAGLGICKYRAAAAIGVGILKSSGEDDADCDTEAVGHLSLIRFG